MSLNDAMGFVGPVGPGHVYGQNADGVVNIRGRTYGFHSGGGTLFRINDTVTPAMAMLARTFPAELNKALASLGWILRKKVREAMRAGGPPGTNWPKSAGIGKLQKRGDRAWRTRASNPNTGHFGHLYMAVGYMREKSLQRVRVGFLSKESARYAVWVQQGFKTGVTARMRGLFSARGLKIGKKTSIETPARPLVEPVFRAVEDQIAPYIEAKIASYLVEKRLLGRVG